MAEPIITIGMSTGRQFSHARSFRVAAPFVWNNLPRHLRNDEISREQFARDLKTFLFAAAYRQRRL